MAKPTAITKLSDLIPDEHNANRGTERGRSMLDDSLRSYGAGRSIVIDKHGKIIAGNKTVEAAARLGLGRVIVVPTDGNTVVAVQRTDLDLDKDRQAKELALADNRVGQVSLEWDASVIAELENDVDLSKFWNEQELVALLGSDTGAVGGSDESSQLRATFSVLVEALDESQQSRLLDKLNSEGYQCRALIS